MEDAIPGTMALVTRLSRRVWRETGDEELGMTMKEFVALTHIHHGQATLTQQRLGEILCMDANNLVLLLNQLEKPGLITRRRDPADRRRHLVEITPAGDAALRRAEKSMEEVEDAVLAELDPDDRAALRRLLAKALGFHD